MLVTRFCYYTAQGSPQWEPNRSYGEPQGLSPLAIINPQDPVTRGQKTVTRAANDLARTRLMLNQPTPPLPPRVRWKQTRAQADPALAEVSVSRLDMLRQGRGEAAT